MAGEKRYTRIPPESTGDRVYMIHTAEIEYKTFNSVAGGSTDHVWKVGERYDIVGFGGGGKVHVHGVFDRGNGTGILSVHYNKTAKFDNFEPTQNAAISYDSQDVAQVDVFYDVYIPAQNIMGYDNPEYGWDIDRFGSGQVTFAEGNPQITGMGSLKINDARLLASYDFSKSNLPNEFVNSREGGNAVSNTWDPLTRGVKLTVGTTAGERVTHTSNLFHSYEEGTSMLFVMAARADVETGTENNTKLWGAFDATDGFFFQIKGSDSSPGGRATPADAIGTGPGSALRVVHRFTFNNQATKNHEIVQKEWNTDTLLGNGGANNPSGIKLDVSKINTYWIDFQFMGGGRTRWGVFFEGQRIVCHEMYHHNGIGTGTQNNNPIGNPNRPVCWAQANYGTTGSSSEFYAYGAGVFIEGVTDPLRASQQISKAWDTKHFGRTDLEPYWRTKQTRNGSTSFPATLKSGTASSGTSTQYHGSLSPIQFLSNGDENHSIYQPLSFEVSSYDIRTGNAVPVEIRLFYGCINRGFDFGSPSISSPTVIVDEGADHLAHLQEIGQFVVQGDGLFRFDLLSDNFQYGTVRNLSDQSLSRALQPIVSWKSVEDKYTTGHSPVLIDVGPHPVFGESKHYFADTQPVVIRETDGDQDVATVLGTTFTGKTAGGSGYASQDQVDNPNDWYYLSYVTRSQAWLYNSQADIADDRLVRTLAVNNCTSLDIGQKLTVTTGSHTAFIMKIDVDKGVEDANVIAASTASNGVEYQIVTVGGTDYTTAAGASRNVPGEIFTATATAPSGGTGTIVATSNAGTVAICGRSAAEASYSGAFTTDGGGSGTIASTATNASLANDYWTSLKALTYTDLGMGADVDITTGLALYASPPPRAVWTFMAKHLDSNEEDADGDALAVDWNNVRLNWSIYWRERTQ